MPTTTRCSIRILFPALMLVLAGCGAMPTSGPSKKQIEEGQPRAGTAVIHVVDVDDAVTRRLLEQRRTRLFSESLGQVGESATSIGPGDTLEVNIWEAPPATLFGTGPADPRAAAAASGSRATTLP